MRWWTRSWNPVIGCQHVSAGCLRCWAERLASRFAGPGQPFAGVAEHGRWTGRVRCLAERLTIPMHWRKPQSIFVCDMSDLFHPSVPNGFIAAVFGVMAATPRHRYYVLTKRAERMEQWFQWVHSDRGCSVDTYVQDVAHVAGVSVPMHRVKGTYLAQSWPLPNVWLGVTAEDQAGVDGRLGELLRTPAAHRFLSVEPLLGPVELHSWLWMVPSPGARAQIDWVVVGGESGPQSRPCDVSWVRDVVRQCHEAAVPRFVKQLGARPISDAPSLPVAQDAASILRFGEYDPDPIEYHYRDRAGADPAEWPEDLRVREVP